MKKISVLYYECAFVKLFDRSKLDIIKKMRIERYDRDERTKGS